MFPKISCSRVPLCGFHFILVITNAPVDEIDHRYEVPFSFASINKGKMLAYMKENSLGIMRAGNEFLPPRFLVKIRVFFGTWIECIVSVTHEHILCELVASAENPVKFVLACDGSSYLSDPGTFPTRQRNSKKSKQHTIILWLVEHIL